MSLQQHQSNPSRLANEIGMLRSSMSGPIVLVEGITDTRLFKKLFLPSPHVRVIHCRGKSNVLKAVELVAGRGIAGVLAICDADFDRIIGTSYPSNVIFPDYHDTEVMIVSSSAFSHFHDELYEQDSSEIEVERVRKKMFNYCGQIGKMRLWSLQNGGAVKFKGVDVGCFLDAVGRFDIAAFAASISSRQSCTVSAAVLSTAGQGASAFIDQELSCGHDLTALLDADAARRLNRAPLGGKVVEKMLRLSFDYAAFSQTQMAEQIRAWQEKHKLELIAAIA